MMNPTTVDKIMEFESGEMSPNDVVRFFGELIDSGLVWKLQGSYGRTAHSLIENGYLSIKGTVLKLPEDE